MIRGKGALSLNSIADVWKNVLDRLRSQLSETTINTWFDEVEVVTMEDSAFVLHCSNSFKKSTIEARFMSHIKAALKDIFSSDLEVKILDDQQLSAYHGVAPDRPGSLLESDAFTFGTYVVGPQNKMAYAAARAVAEKPAEHYNPLFIYGDSGLGKTHLLYAIAHQVRQRQPEARIVYIKGDDFTNELIASIREGKNAEFREKYRQSTLLLVDDIQFIAGKESTQEEFFHTFNSLHDAHKQIVIASDRPAKEIKSLEERLRTRFEWGLTADVQPPDFETRVAIVKRKAELLHLDLPEDVAEFIANHLKNNIRQLEGAVKKLNAYYMLEGIAPCIGVTTTAIKDTLNDTQPIPVTIEKIINEVARTYNVIPSDIRGKKRSANVSAARQMSMYIIREITGMSMEAIGSEFQRDHSTVVYSINTMEKNIGKDRHLKETVDDIMKNIRT